MIIRSFVEDNGLRMERGFTYNPNVSETGFPVKEIPGGTGTRTTRGIWSEEKPE